MKKSFQILTFFMAILVALTAGYTCASAAASTISVSNLEPGDQVDYIQLIKYSNTARTGWEFTESWIGDIFFTNYKLAAVAGETAAEKYQRTIDEVLKDYEGISGTTAGTSPAPSAAIAGARNASVMLRNTLSEIHSSIESNNSRSYATPRLNPVGNGSDAATITVTNDNTDMEKAGMYLIHITPGNNNHNLYDNMAAYLNFGSYDNNGHPSTLPSFQVKAKKAADVVHKELDNPRTDSSVSLGDVVHYTITATHPYLPSDYEDYNFYEYKLIDRCEQLRNYVIDEILIKDGDNTLYSSSSGTLHIDTDYYLEKIERNANNNGDNYIKVDSFNGLSSASNAIGFCIEFYSKDKAPNAQYNPNFAGKTIVIKYHATVVKYANESSPRYPYKVINDARSETKMRKQPGATDTWTTESKITLTSYAIKIIKKNGSDQNLAGAHFKCYATNPATTTTATPIKFYKSGNQYYVQHNENDAMEQYVLDNNTGYRKDCDDLEVDSNGELVILGLDADHTYYFVETQAPAGYSLNDTWFLSIPSQTVIDNGWVVTKNNNNIIETKEYTINSIVNVSQGQGTPTINNNAGSIRVTAVCVDTVVFKLPSTGALGAYIFTFLGTACMSAAIILFLRESKLKEKFRFLKF